MEQSPFLVVEPGSESPRQSQEQSKVLGSHCTGSAGEENPQVPILPGSSDSHFGLGERVRLLLTAVTATSCRGGEGEVSSKTTRKTIGKDHGERTLDICS